MKCNISDLMAYLHDDTIDLTDPGITTPERILAMVTDTPVPAQRRTPRKLWRTTLVAAVITAALAVAAFAVYQYSMDNRVLEAKELVREDGSTVARYSPVGYAEGESSEETNLIASDSGYRVSSANSGNPEYLALQEWIEYSQNTNFDEDEPRLDAESPYRMCYPVLYEAEMVKLKEISETYRLRLLEGYETFGQLDDFYSISGLAEFMPLAGKFDDKYDCSGIVYDDGSFNASALKTPLSDSNENDTVNINIYRAMKGSLCDIYILGDAPEKYTNEAYATEDGTLVDLALGEYYSMIFAELDNCYVTFFLNGGTNPSEHLSLLTMEDLKYIADSIDFSILAQ